MKKIKDLTGLRFGNLTVVEFTGVTVPGRGAIWLCKCDCGNERKVATNHLNYGQITQCEKCVKRDRQKRALKVVDVRNKRDRLRSVWNNMKYRCFNPDCDVYKHYGGRGITMCKEWAEDYKTFYDWAFSHGYSEGLTIERIDVNGNYCPENCRFISMREQSYNKRNTRRIFYKGKDIPLGLIAHELGIDSQVLYLCLKRCVKAVSL